jgi:hypothetical protein
MKKLFQSRANHDADAVPGLSHHAATTAAAFVEEEDDNNNNDAAEWTTQGQSYGDKKNPLSKTLNKKFGVFNELLVDGMSVAARVQLKRDRSTT